MEYITEDEMRELLTDFKKDVIENIQETGHWASGKTAKKIRVLAKEQRVSMPSYIDTLQYGRKGGKYPYFGAIKAWAQSKGLTFNSESELNSFAYFTTKKIGELGTKQYRDNEYTDIYDGPQEKLADAISELEAERIEEELVEKYNKSFDNYKKN